MVGDEPLNAGREACCQTEKFGDLRKGGAANGRRQ